jgi:hypothetical protein
MNDATPRTADLIALAQATDDNGRVDLTAYQAQRMILLHQSIDGLDAKGLVRELTDSPAYANAEGRSQIGPLLDAISSRLPSNESQRFSEALDNANVSDSPLERKLEHLGENLSRDWQSLKQAAGAADTFVGDQMVAAKQWAQSVRSNDDAPYQVRTLAAMGASEIGNQQQAFGEYKGENKQALQILGDTVDLAKFALRFSTDDDFRGVIIGAGLMYASDAMRDPSKPARDVAIAGVGAWNEWKEGLDAATKNGKQLEYLGGTKGAAGVEVLSAMLPTTGVLKLGRVARALDVADDLVPSHLPEGAARRAAGQGSNVIEELAAEAIEKRALGGVDKQAADFTFTHLANLKRSQGELRELVDGMRQAGHLDGLLQSGVLAPKELGYLARQDISTFKNVSFDESITAYVGKKDLSELKDWQVGDIGEATLGNTLAQKGYRDLVPIQNKSGHGNDMTGIHPKTGRWEVFEVKASVQGIARAQTGDPGELITPRLQKAADATEASWRPHNQWEELAQPTAKRILDETLNPETLKVDIDAKWARVNIEKDAASGLVKAEPQIENWLPPAERKAQRKLGGAKADGDDLPEADTPKLRQNDPSETKPIGPPITASNTSDRDDKHVVGLTTGLQVGNDFREKGHPGNAAYERMLSEVQRMETTNDIPHGPNSALVAAALTVKAEQNKFYTAEIVRMEPDGRVSTLKLSLDGPGKKVTVDPKEVVAQGQSFEKSTEAWSLARSPNYASDLPAAERTQGQVNALAQMTPIDRALFDKIRQNVPSHINDDVVAQAALETKKQGMLEADKMGTVDMVGNKIMVRGVTPEKRSTTDTNEPAPPMAETVKHIESFNQQLAIDLRLQQEQALAKKQEQENQGPSMQIGGIAKRGGGSGSDGSGGGGSSES